MAKEKVALISLGCPKNLVNSEQMLYLLCEAGYELVPEPAMADAVVINTCGFIEAAKSEAIDTIIEMGALKSAGEIRAIIVAGCLSQRYSGEILTELPEIDAVLGVGSFDDIVEAVESALAGCGISRFGDINAPVSETGRVVSTGPGWAYLRIAEGCSNRCAFCAIPFIRGRYRSREMSAVLDEARALAQTGVKELIIVAQDITRYGADLYGERRLAELLRALCGIDGIEWIRLHYLYPDSFDDELLQVISSEDKILSYLDIPIQHVNDAILARMNRRGSGAEVRALFEKLRRELPGVVLRTSLIVGLPGEGEAEFEELAQFLREVKIERAGIFAYSPEEGTPAAEMTDRCSPEEALRRQELLAGLQAEIMDEWSAGFVGRTVRVLCEGYDVETGLQFGRSFADSPDIDGTVFFSGECPAGEFAEVFIERVSDGDWFGRQI